MDQNRRQPRSAGGFDDQFAALQTGDNRLGDLLVVDGQEFHPGPFDDPERQLTRSRHSDSVSHGAHRVQRHRVSGGQRRRIGRGVRGLDAHQSHIGQRLTQTEADPSQQPTTAGAHRDGADLRVLFGDLEANRRLAGNDIRVVEGMDQHSAGPLAVGSGSHQRIINGVTGEFDLGPVRQRCFDLWQRRPLA